MKKLTALLLILALLLSGCATANEPKALEELGTGKRTESLVVVTITINPEFELYLDADFCITKVRCLNEDAVTVLAAVQENLVGVNYGSAMFTILDGAAQTGFLSPDAQVTIETTLHTTMDEESLAFMAQTVASPVEAYNESNGLTLSVNAPTPTVDEKTAQAFMEYFEKQMANQSSADSSVMVNSNEVFDIFYDENGNRLGTFLHVYDADGHLLKSELFYDDGSYSCQTYEYDASGNQTKWEYLNPDGTSGVTTYYANGSIKSDTYTDAESFTYVRTYYENGNPATYTSTGPDGSTHSETYYENGNPQQIVSDYPNGDHFEYHYAEDGTLIDEVIETRPWNMGEPNSVVESSAYNDHGEGVSTQYFDENGYLYKMVAVYPDGATYETTYYESGEVKSTKSNDQYGTNYTFYTEDGIEVPNIGEPNSVTESFIFTSDGQGTSTKYFDGNGYLYKSEEVLPNGTRHTFTYYPSGEVHTCITFDAGTTFQWIYYEDGTLQKYIEDGSGKYYEIHHYPNGQMSLQIHREGSINLERHYDEEGNITYSNDPNWQP